MAYTHPTSPPKLAETARVALPRGVGAANLFCYAAFALSFGFAVAVVFGLIH